MINLSRMNLRKILFISLLLMSVNIQAQVSFFVEASGNASLIAEYYATQITEFENSDRLGYTKFLSNTYGGSYSNKPGAGLTAGLQYFIKQGNISLDAAIDFNNVNFHQTLTTYNYYFYQSTTDYKIENATNPAPVRTEKADNHSQYLLSLPVSFSYYFLEKNLSVSLGLVPGLLVYSTGGNGASTDFNKTQVGIQVQLRYQFVPQWWLMAGFQEYSTKLYDASLKQSFSNLRLMKLGVKYDI